MGRIHLSGCPKSGVHFYVPVIYAKNNLVAFNGDYGLKRDGGYIVQPGNNLVYGNLPDNYHDWVAADSDIQLDPELDPLYVDLEERPDLVLFVDGL